MTSVAISGTMILQSSFIGGPAFTIVTINGSLGFTFRILHEFGFTDGVGVDFTLGWVSTEDGYLVSEGTEDDGVVAVEVDGALDLSRFDE